jgi:predicted nucleic acid-binding protein
VIVLDASVLIAYLDATDPHHPAATRLLSDHAAEPFAVTVLTMAEVLVGPTRAGRAEPVTTAMRDLDVEVLSLGPNDAVALGGLRASTRLPMPDCCVLLSATRHEAGLATFDQRLVSASVAAGVPVVQT